LVFCFVSPRFITEKFQERNKCYTFADMKQGQHNTIIRMTALLMVAAMSLLILNKALFTHTHITKGGQIVSHSHPFKPETGNNSPAAHQHTAVQFHLLDNLQLFYPILFLLLTLALFSNKKNYNAGQKAHFSKLQIASRYGRAPPVLPPPH